MTDNTLLDSPMVRSFLFHPRSARQATAKREGVSDGTVSVGSGVVLGYRCYVHQPDSPLILYFHGNGEIVPDHDNIAPMYHRIGVSLLVVDYRGYGWSTGEPLTSTLLSDGEVVVDLLPSLLSDCGVNTDVPLYLMGRSLGSAPAIHLAHRSADRFKGLIIESGFAEVIPLLMRMGLPIQLDPEMVDPIGNLRKIAEVDLPLLVIHGEQDQLIPISNGEALYGASSASLKHFERIANAGHNDILFTGMIEYFQAVKDFIKKTG